MVGALLYVLAGLCCWSVILAVRDVSYYLIGPQTQKPCRHCGGVAIPEHTICPDCFVERHHAEDPFDA